LRAVNASSLGYEGIFVNTGDVFHSPWFGSFGVKPDAKLRLLAFPFAGGSCTVFRRWPHYLPGEVEVFPVQLPGRGARLREEPISDIACLAAMVADAIEPLLDRPYAIFGQCMGGLLGFEVTRELRRRNAPPPLKLYVASRRGPQLPLPWDPVTDLPDEQFIQRVSAINGTPTEILENRNLLDVMLPTMRVDFRLCETYQYTPEDPLRMPVSIAGGKEDFVDETELDGWRLETTGPFEKVLFDGGHFFAQTNEADFLAHLSVDLATVIEGLWRFPSAMFAAEATRYA
jgi:medium-chain acyl-[acyl-carrier-protein] hydrolase